MPFAEAAIQEIFPVVQRLGERGVAGVSIDDEGQVKFRADGTHTRGTDILLMHLTDAHNEVYGARYFNKTVDEATPAMKSVGFHAGTDWTAALPTNRYGEEYYDTVGDVPVIREWEPTWAQGRFLNSASANPHLQFYCPLLRDNPLGQYKYLLDDDKAPRSTTIYSRPPDAYLSPGRQAFVRRVGGTGLFAADLCGAILAAYGVAQEAPT